MMAQLLAAPSRAYYGSAFVRALLSQVNEPRAETVLRLERVATRLARPADIDGYIDVIRRAPATAAMLAQRYLPAPYTLEGLARCAPGTLGHAYRTHMIANGLRADFFEPIDPRDDFQFMRLRMYQTHDLWHVLTGYPTDVAGEVSIVGFYLGHFDKYLGPDGYPAMVFTALLAGTTLLHAALRNPALLSPFYRGLVEGFSRGQAARALFAARWEEHWDRPLEELRAEYGIPPRRVYETLQ